MYSFTKRPQYGTQYGTVPYLFYLPNVNFTLFVKCKRGKFEKRMKKCETSGCEFWIK
jgi:hypothetical protein